MNNTAALRRSLRLLRNRISPSQRSEFNYAINQRFIRSGLLLRTPYIASVLANDGEVDLSLLIQTCSERGIPHFLPIIKKNKQLRFSHYHWGGPLLANKYGIPEPTHKHILPSKFLTAIVLPLVGFDLNGNRLGMGGGYYDRTLSFVNQQNCKKRPLLIGAAFEVQLTNQLKPNTWDIPLDAVITEQRTLVFSKRAQAQLVT